MESKTLNPFLLFLFLLLTGGWTACSQSVPENESSSIDLFSLPLHQVPGDSMLLFESGIRSILEDRHGNIWFGSHNEGVAKYDGKQFTYYTTEDGLSGNQVRSIYEDKEGIVWFECGFGISRFDGNQMLRFENKDYNGPQTWKLDSSDLWFKGDEAIGYNSAEERPGVYHWDGNQMTFLVFPTTDIPLDGNTYSVSTPFSNGKKKVWFGTYGAAFGYNGQSFEIIGNQKLADSNIPGTMHIRSIYEDSRGTLWIGNNGIGVLTLKNDTLINFSDQMGIMSENSGRSGGFRSPPGSLEHVFAIGEDQDGNIWFGDRDTGAWRYDGTSMKNFTAEDGIETTHIWQIVKTKKGELWFAMDDGTVLQFNNEKFERIY